MSLFAIDFDGTCVDHRYPDVGPDVPGAVAVLTALAAGGHQLMLNTMRSGRYLDEAVAWFEAHELPLHGANENPDQRSWTESPKVYAHHYIDDAAVGCPLSTVPGFQRECVDWQGVARLLGLDEVP